MSHVVLGETLGMFVNILTADDKYPVKIVRIGNSQFKCYYRENEKLFLNFLYQFLNLYKVLNILIEKMMFIANVFPKLQPVENFVRIFSQKSSFSTRFDSQHVKASQIFARYQ